MLYSIVPAVSCGPVAIPQNAQVIEGDPITGTRYRDTITIICDEGFTVEGYSTISCLASGVWNASLAKCELVIGNLISCDFLCIEQLSSISLPGCVKQQ